MWSAIIFIFMCLLFITPPIVIDAVDRRIKNVEKLSKHKPSIVRTIHNDGRYKEYKRGESGFTTGRFMYRKFSNVEHYLFIEVRFDVNRKLFVDAADLKWVEYCDANAKPYDSNVVSDGIITYGYDLCVKDDTRKQNEEIINNNIKNEYVYDIRERHKDF